MMDSIMPIITGIIEGQVLFIVIALAIVFVLLISLLILQKRTTDRKKTRGNNRITVEGIFTDTALQSAVAKNLGVVVNEPITIDDLTQLKKLVVEYANIGDLKGIGNLKNLEEVSFSNNNISEIPAEFAELTNLRSIKLAYNNLQDIGPLTRNTKLQSIDVSGNNLKADVSPIYALPDLEELVLINTEQTSISPKVAEAKKLKRLNISYNSIAELPVELAKIAGLEILNIGNNKLTTLPSELSTLKNITEFAMTGNVFSDIPETVQELLRGKKISIPKIAEAVIESTPKPALAESIAVPTVKSEPAETAIPNIAEKGTTMNTFIDLTSSHDNLLAELEALEVIKPQTIPEVVKEPLKEEPIKAVVETAKDIVEPIKDEAKNIAENITEKVKGGKEEMFSKVEKEVSEAMDAIEGTVANVGNSLEDKLKEVTISEQSVTTPIEKDATKKEKIKKIIMIGTGAALAIGAIAGGVYAYTKAENDKKKRKGIFHR